MEKCLFKVEGQEAKEVCRTDQLCRVMEAGIKLGVHAMCLLWQQHVQEEEWGFLPIDA